MEGTREVRLPVGYVAEGRRYPVAFLRPLSGKALLRARTKLGDSQDPSLFLDLLRETVAGFQDYSGPIAHEDIFWVDADEIFRQLALWESEESGEPLVVRRTCPHCGRTGECRVPAHEIPVRYVEDTEFGKYPDLLIPVKLAQPLTTLDVERTPVRTVKIGLLTVGDEVSRIQKYGKQPGRLWVEGIRLMIYEAGPKRKGELTPGDVENMSSLDIKRLERVYLANEPGLGPIPDLVCPFCERAFTPDPAVTWVFDFLLAPGVRG